MTRQVGDMNPELTDGGQKQDTPYERAGGDKSSSEAKGKGLIGILHGVCQLNGMFHFFIDSLHFETYTAYSCCRHVYTTPKSFLELLKLYNVLLSSKRENQDNAIERLTTGLQKLRETKDAVTSLEEDLKVHLFFQGIRLAAITTSTLLT